ncbi:Hypothetical predicted protein [Cloeon dipterum]|uniref:Uncharacterized protein n=1 Tax=Cloeon dipterum TaxID=197152 RepID=A0A8S1CMB5_9INSE|nr:Hypothetical predicted protein [Cloeon dipterum]
MNLFMGRELERYVDLSKRQRRRDAEAYYNQHLRSDSVTQNVSGSKQTKERVFPLSTEDMRRKRESLLLLSERQKMQKIRRVAEASNQQLRQPVSAAQNVYDSKQTKEALFPMSTGDMGRKRESSLIPSERQKIRRVAEDSNHQPLRSVSVAQNVSDSKQTKEALFPLSTEVFQRAVLKNLKMVRNKLASIELSVESIHARLDQLQNNPPNNVHKESTTKPAAEDTFDLKLPLKGPKEFFDMEENLDEKSYYEKLLKATKCHIARKGFQLSGTNESKIKKCICNIIMPLFFSPSLVQVSSKAGQGRKNVVKIAGTLFINLIADAINQLEKDFMASQEMVETFVGDYLRREGSKLRKDDADAQKTMDQRKAPFSPYSPYRMSPIQKEKGTGCFPGTSHIPTIKESPESFAASCSKKVYFKEELESGSE